MLLYKLPEEIDVGVGASLRISAYKQSSEFRQGRLHEFYLKCREVLVTMIIHMMEKSPLKSAFMRYSNALNPMHMVERSEEELNVQRFSKMIQKLVGMERLSSKEGDDAKQQYGKMLSTVVPRHKERFLSFDKYSDWLDEFFKEILPEKGF